MDKSLNVKTTIVQLSKTSNEADLKNILMPYLLLKTQTKNFQSILTMCGCLFMVEKKKLLEL